MPPDARAPVAETKGAPPEGGAPINAPNPSDHVCNEMLVIGKVVSWVVVVQSPPLCVECKPLPNVNAPVTALPDAKLLPAVVTTPERVPDVT